VGINSTPSRDNSTGWRWREESESERRNAINSKQHAEEENHISLFHEKIAKDGIVFGHVTSIPFVVSR
jgi:hypothetical protein